MLGSWFMKKIISYHELVGIEKQNLQRGMNYRCSVGHSVFLMSTRSNAPYDDQIAADGRILIYEGHNCDKRHSKNPKEDNQPRFLASGKITESIIEKPAALDFKNNNVQQKLSEFMKRLKMASGLLMVFLS